MFASPTRLPAPSPEARSRRSRFPFLRPQTQPFSAVPPPSESAPAAEAFPPSQQLQPAADAALEGAARTLVGAMCDDDRAPELWDVISTAHSGSFYVPGLRAFESLDPLPIPPYVIALSEKMRLKMGAGVFPEIGCAYTHVDATLVLWRCRGGAIDTIDNLDPVVTAVAVAPVRPGVFKDQFRHVLVVATAVDVQLFVVGNVESGGLQVLRTQLSAPLSGGLDVRKIVGTANGRIFYGGTDGYLYELVYRERRSWITQSRVRVDCVSGSVTSRVRNYISYMVRGADPIAEMAVDRSRNIVYTLSEQSTIRVFDLGPSGECSPTLVATVSAPWQLAFNLVPEMALRPHDGQPEEHVLQQLFEALKQRVPQNLELLQPMSSAQKWDALKKHGFPSRYIVSLCPILSTESGRVHLVAVTETGVRLFFSTFPRAVFDGRPSTLELVHVRPPPPWQNNAFQRVITASYSQGVFIFASRDWSNGKVLLFAAARDFARVTDFSSPITLRESKELLEIPVRSVFQIEEEPAAGSESLAPPPRRSVATRQRVPLPGCKNELATQSLSSGRRLLCFTDAGIMTIGKQRPLDALRNIIGNASGNESDGELKRFFDRYGAAQACAMCLTLCCFSPSPSEAQWAQRAFFKYSSAPAAYSSSDQVAVAAQSGGQMRLSAMHEGIAIFLSRILRPIWIAPVSRLQRQGAPDLAVAWAPDQLLNAQRVLGNVRSFLESCPQFGLDENQRMRMRQQSAPLTDRDAFEQYEHQMLLGMHMAVAQTAEALALLEVLLEYFPVLTPRLPREELAWLQTAEIAGLLLEPQGRATVRDLINELHAHFRRTNRSTDEISQQLSERCPTFFSQEYRDLLLGMDLLAQARAASSEQLELTLLQQAFVLLREVPGVDVVRVCAVFEEAGFYDGLVHLALTQAFLSDPNDLASKYAKERQSEGRAEYEFRLSCYERVLSLFDRLREGKPLASFKRQAEGRPQLGPVPPDVTRQLVAAALEYNDRLWHTRLYDWFMVNGMTSELLQLQTVFVLDYLKESPNSSDLVWRYYVSQKQDFEAAKTLYNFATTSRDPSITLNQRVEALVRAKNLVFSDQTAAGASGDAASLATFAKLLQESVDVAQLQVRVQNALRAYGDRGADPAAELDGELATITKLYNRYIRVFALYDLALAAFHLSSFEDATVIRSTWNEIIRRDYPRAADFAAMEQTLENLGHEHFPSDAVFPVDFLVAQLNQRYFAECKRAGSEPVPWVARALLRVGVPPATLFDSYASLYDTEMEWLGKEHLLVSIVFVLQAWMEATQGALRGSTERRALQRVAVRVQKFCSETATKMSASPRAAALHEALQDANRTITR